MLNLKRFSPYVPLSLNKKPEPEIIAEAEPESKEELAEEKSEKKGIIEEAEKTAEKELAVEEKEENIAEGLEESETVQAGAETEPLAEKEINEEIQPKDFE